MTSLHHIQVVDHFRRWTIQIEKCVKVRGLNCFALYTIRVPCYYHIFNCLTYTVDKLTDKTDCLSFTHAHTR